MMRTATLPAVFLLLTTSAMAQWTQLSPTNSPSPRIRAQISFDAAANRTVLFGGADNAAFPPANFGDTWTWDGFDWSQQSPAASPSARFFGGMVYDVIRNVTVLYGGLSASMISTSYKNDTWEYDGTNWTQVTTANTPGGLVGNNGISEVAMAYDLFGQRTVLFGGELFQGIVPMPNVTLLYDGANWTQASPAVSPPRRSQASMCTANSLGGVLLFGGTNFNNPPGTNGEVLWNDTWVYSSTNDTWTQIVTSGAVPVARAGASLLYDHHAGVYVLHGGYREVAGLIAPLSDTWTFDGTNWTDVTATYGSPTAPLVRFSSADGPGGCHVLFGGSTAVFGTINNNTWVSGCTANASAFGSGCPGSWGTPQLVAASRPALGTSFDLQTTNLDPNGILALMFFGFSNTNSPLGPLPVSLQPFGFGAGCNLLVSGGFFTLFPTTAGAGSYSMALPANLALAGIPVYFQGASIDNGAPGGLAVSNGVGGALGF